jgi:hypothetical protein
MHPPIFFIRQTSSNTAAVASASSHTPSTTAAVASASSHTTHRSSRYRGHCVVVHGAGKRKQEQPRQGEAYGRKRHLNARNSGFLNRVFRLKPPFVFSIVECFQIEVTFPQLSHSRQQGVDVKYCYRGLLTAPKFACGGATLAPQACRRALQRRCPLQGH